MTKTCQDNNGIIISITYIGFLKHFYEYLTEKLKYRDVTCLISFCHDKYAIWNKNLVKNS